VQIVNITVIFLIGLVNHLNKLALSNSKSNPDFGIFLGQNFTVTNYLLLIHYIDDNN
jgi:hypothetical protein